MERSIVLQVYHCYHSLNGTDETVIAVKRKYLASIIESIIKYDRCAVCLPMHPGPTYQKICKEWRKEKLDENISKKEIDFEQLRKDLYDDFNKTIQEAEEKGIFKEDDAKNLEEMRRLWDAIDLKNF